jgi:hypothetical protein
MLSITDKDIRAYLRKRFKEFNKLYKPFLGRKLNLNNLDTLFVEARKIAKISRITINQACGISNIASERRYCLPWPIIIVRLLRKKRRRTIS